MLPLGAYGHGKIMFPYGDAVYGSYSYPSSRLQWSRSSLRPTSRGCTTTTRLKLRD